MLAPIGTFHSKACLSILNHVFCTCGFCIRANLFEIKQCIHITIIVLGCTKGTGHSDMTQSDRNISDKNGLCNTNWFCVRRIQRIDLCNNQICCEITANPSSQSIEVQTRSGAASSMARGANSPMGKAACMHTVPAQGNLH